MIQNQEEAALKIKLVDQLNDGKDNWLYEKLSGKMKRKCRGFSGRFELIKSFKWDFIQYPVGAVFDENSKVLVVGDGSRKRIECFECTTLDQKSEDFDLLHLGGLQLKDSPYQLLIESKSITKENGRLDSALIICEGNRVVQYNLTEMVEKLRKNESLDNFQPISVIDLNNTSDDFYPGGINSAAFAERDGKKQLLICCDYGNLFGDLSDGSKDSKFTKEIFGGNFCRDGCWLGDGKLAVSGQQPQVFSFQNGKWEEEYSIDFAGLIDLPQRLLYDETNSILYISDFTKHKILAFDLILKKKIKEFDLPNVYSMNFIRNEDGFIMFATDYRGGLHFFK